MKKIYEMIMKAFNGNLQTFPAARRRLTIGSVSLLAFLFAGAQAGAVVTTSVSLTAPFDGREFLAPASISLTAEASSATGTITTVGFYNGTNLLGSDIAVPYAYTWTNVAAGAYSLTAQAVENSGAVHTSAVAVIQVRTVVVSTNIFTAAGLTTWICPDNVTSVVVECWGAGGAGGSAARTSGTIAQYGCGGGGGGGAYAKYNVYPVIPGNNYYINVGAGGFNNFIGNTGRVSGADSWFNSTTNPSSTIIAKGGAGGESATTTEYGLGGIGTTNGSAGNIVYAGGSGAAGAVNSAGGGGSSAGTNSAGTNATSNAGATAPAGGGNGGTGPTTNEAVGGQGFAPGGGGSGARSENFLKAGGTGASGQVVLTFKAGVAPSVIMTAPTNGAVFIAPATIALTANASDADGVITNVSFYNGVTLLGSSATSPYAYTLTNVAASSLNLMARATDNSGTIRTSAVVTITVVNPTYVLTVNNGTGGGSYTNGKLVAIAVSNAPSGKAFDKWIGDTQYLASVTSPSNIVTMSTNPVTLTATYVDIYYALTVNSGTGGGTYTNGAQAAITANAISGKAFDKWTGATNYVASVTSAATTVTMPASNMAVTATYKDVYALTVVDGTGDGSYTNGAQVDISAEAPVLGKAFAQWIGDTQYVNNVTYTNARVTMSTNPVTLFATYVDVYYALTVNSGAGGGTYTNGTQVAISAAAPPTGMTFDKWTGDAQFVNNVTYTNALLTMPAQAVALTATYKNLPGRYTLTVNNGAGSGAYTNGEQVTITATNTPESGAVFDRWAGDTQAVAGVFSLNTIVTMPASNITLTASCVEVSNGVANVTWASYFIYYEPAYDPLVVDGQSTIAQLMYSPDDIKDSILPGGAGAVNDVAWDTITLTDAYGTFSTNTVRAGTNGYVYALIFQDNTVQAGDLYVAGPLLPLVDGAADVNVCADPANGDAINGVNSAPVIEGNATYVLTVNNGSGGGTYTNAQVVEIEANAPASGTAFSRWTGATQYVNNVTNTNATVTIPASNITLTATYKNLSGYYTLTITNGSGSGSYTNGQQVSVVASNISGKAFVQWTGTTQVVNNVTYTNATVTMPASNVTLTATYVDVSYGLTVNSGAGGGTYTNGQQVAIAANAPAAGKAFSRWIGDTQYVASVISSNTTVTMPAQAIALTATYTDVPYTLTVTSGSGDGSYTNGQQVAIAAETIFAKVFYRWTGATQVVADVASATTTVTMPAQAVTLTATYTDAYYPLTVIGGSGSGSYTNGTQVAIAAGNAPTGQVFDQWSGDTANVSNIFASNTTVTMSARVVSLTATYKTLYTLAVTNGSNSGSYTNGTLVGPVASNAPTGQVFARWIGDTQYVSNVTSPNPLVTMPASNISITATYTNLPNWYTLTVVGGSQNGGGVYFVGTTNVAISATATSRTFVAWTGNTGALSSNTASTTVTIPGSNITVAAAYSDVLLTVNSGDGSGSYTNGQQVPITASNAPSGQVFDKWTGATQYVAGVTNTNALVTLPAQDITLTATYKSVYTLTVTNGSGSGSYTNGAKVTITASNLTGQIFAKWTGATQSVASVTSVTTTVTMPASNIAVTATYNNLYVLTVTGGIGGGSYTNGAQVAIAADTAPSGKTFDKWTGATQSVASVTSATTTVIMPASNLAVTATYKEAYTLTVTGGAGGGSYAAGSLVPIAAIVPVGYDFDRWTGQTQYVANVMSSNTTVTMPAADISVTAIYQTGYYAFTVIGGTGSGSYTNGQRVAIAATIPTGMTFVKWNDGNTNASRTVTVPPAPVTYTATVIDMQKPTVKITYPANKSKVMTNGTVIIRGTAADNVGLTGVMHQLYTGEWTNAVTTNGWKNWTANFYPVSGLNTARVYSVDTQGNTSETATVVFTYVPGAVMQVQINGDGTVKPDYNGKMLEIGKIYKMTAKAAKYSSFTNWTYGVGGPVAANKSKITFVMQSNLVLTANFRSRLETFAMADIAVAAPTTPQAAIVVDGSAKDWANVPRSSFSYASVTQEVAAALDGNNIALLLTGCPFETSDNVLVYFKLRLSYGTADNRHSVDLWTSGSVLYGMVDGQVIAGLEAVLLNGVLEVKLPVEQVPSQVTIEEIGCGMDLGGGTLTELFKIVSP